MGMLILPQQWAGPITGWAGAMRAGGRAETTIRTRTEHLRWLARDHPHTSPWHLTLADLLEWTGARTWSRETRRGVRASLRGFYAWAVMVGHVTASPATALPRVEPAQPRPHPTPEAAYRAALTAATPRERLMLRLAAELGMRRAEVAVVHTRDVVEDLDGWSLIVHGKGARDRLIPLPPALAAELRTQPPGWVFPGDDHGHLSPRWVGRLITRLLPDPWTMHSLRHRFATRAYAAAGDVLVVQKLLGHASPTTTQVYVRLPEAALRRTVLAAA